ncbi:MAG: UDP-glucose/GDP-mannose dehydrogenase family protein [Candidatus Heimdallarchaeota archaeon]|nr:UDP-glucose/GDP-mannose dehydrogenase family protein [Candidatus Heimdallarchaeota archaeon]MCK4954129.1 UDP-glucose/GDP-mannose dehydrogenase family protein [Candidatus Heimdallarchaeota archaeon]
MSEYEISIVGTGFVGLVTAVCFADRGIKTICSTRNEKNAELINQGIPPFFENGLAELLKKVVDEGNLVCVTSREEAVLKSDVTLIIVGTPFNHIDKSINLDYMKQAGTDIGKALAKKDDYHLVAVRSTVVPGTSRNMVGKELTELSGKELGKDIGLVMQPEFLAEGRSIEDTFWPDRIVIGEYDERSGETLQKLYERFYGDHIGENCPIIRMNIESAELVKYANNSFLATKISFINEISRIAELVPGVDVGKVSNGIGLDYRINHRFLNSGVGWGGSCFPKDLNAIVAFSRSKGLEAKLIQSAIDVNDDQALHAIELAEELLGSFNGKTIALLGLAFKPGTDDMRYAPSRRIASKAVSLGAKVKGYDPKAKESAEEAFGQDGTEIVFVDSVEEVVKDTDCAIVCAEWDEFLELKPEFFINNMRTPCVVDGRRIYDALEFSKQLKYRIIGHKLE